MLPVKLLVYTRTFWVEVSKSRNDKLTVWTLGTYQLPNTELFKGVPVQALTCNMPRKCIPSDTQWRSCFSGFFSSFYYPYTTKVVNQLTNDVLNWIRLLPKHLKLLHHQLQYQAVQLQWRTKHAWCHGTRRKHGGWKEVEWGKEETGGRDAKRRRD